MYWFELHILVGQNAFQDVKDHFAALKSNVLQFAQQRNRGGCRGLVGFGCFFGGRRALFADQGPAHLFPGLHIGEQRFDELEEYTQALQAGRCYPVGLVCFDQFHGCQ